MINYKLIVTGLLTIGSVVGVREYLKPRDIENLLKWKGIKLIESDNDTNAWEASLFENKEELEKMNITTSDQLKNWCLAQMKQGITDELASSAEKYCQDKPSTVMGHIIRVGEKKRFIEGSDNNKAAQIVFVLAKDRAGLTKVMNIKEDLINKTEDFAEIGKQVSDWCNGQKREKAKDEEHLGNVKKYCYDKEVTDIKGLLKKENLKLLESPKDYETRFKENNWNRAQLLIQDIKEFLETKKPKEVVQVEQINGDKGGEYLKQWCDSKQNEDLTGKQVFSDIYPKVKTRCAEPIQPS